MHIFCKLSDGSSDVRCKVCGQGFLVYWGCRFRVEQNEARERIVEALAQHHSSSKHGEVHPRFGFKVPERNATHSFLGNGCFCKTYP